MKISGKHVKKFPLNSLKKARVVVKREETQEENYYAVLLTIEDNENFFNESSNQNIQDEKSTKINSFIENTSQSFLFIQDPDLSDIFTWEGASFILVMLIFMLIFFSVGFLYICDSYRTIKTVYCIFDKNNNELIVKWRYVFHTKNSRYSLQDISDVFLMISYESSGIKISLLDEKTSALSLQLGLNIVFIEDNFKEMKNMVGIIRDFLGIQSNTPLVKYQKRVSPIPEL